MFGAPRGLSHPPSRRAVSWGNEHRDHHTHRSRGSAEASVEVDRIIPDTPSVLISGQDHLPRAMKNFAEVGIPTFPVAAF